MGDGGVILAHEALGGLGKSGVRWSSSRARRIPGHGVQKVAPPSPLHRLHHRHEDGGDAVGDGGPRWRTGSAQRCQAATARRSRSAVSTTPWHSPGGAGFAPEMCHLANSAAASDATVLSREPNGTPSQSRNATGLTCRRMQSRPGMDRASACRAWTPGPHCPPPSPARPDRDGDAAGRPRREDDGVK